MSRAVEGDGSTEALGYCRCWVLVFHRTLPQFVVWVIRDTPHNIHDTQTETLTQAHAEQTQFHDTHEHTCHPKHTTRNTQRNTQHNTQRSNNTQHNTQRSQHEAHDLWRSRLSMYVDGRVYSTFFLARPKYDTLHQQPMVCVRVQSLADFPSEGLARGCCHLYGGRHDCIVLVGM